MDSRIESVGDSSLFKRSEKKKQSEKPLRSVTNFDGVVKKVERKSEISYKERHRRKSREELEKLLDNVYEIGEELKESPSIETIKRYKEAIADFINHVVDEAIELEEKVSGVKILKRKRFTLIRVVNTKLESLAAEVLRNQRDQLLILSRIEEINGLLVDLIS